MKVFTHPSLENISLTTVLQAVADPCRRKIISTLLLAESRALACNEFDLDVSKATASHHFEALRNAGIIESHTEGTKCLSLLREQEVNERFPGLLKLIIDEGL